MNAVAAVWARRLTEHSGCPVLAGEKFITAIWFREGVSADDPWSSYDPCGVPILH